MFRTEKNTLQQNRKYPKMYYKHGKIMKKHRQNWGYKAHASFRILHFAIYQKW